MRLKNVKGSKEMVELNKYYIKHPEDYKNKWKESLNNSNPIHIEIGMGKGKFLTTLASQNPDVNYIGIEKYSSVLIRAMEKQDSLELPNLHFLLMDAEHIEKVFEKNEIERIYLNFSDPWPKDRHAKRRLTSKQFLKRYDNILSRDGLIEFKTDNKVLFEFSLEEVPEAGWKILEYTKNLHDHKMSEGNVMTEYEEKFSSMGNPICKMIISR